MSDVFVLEILNRVAATASRIEKEKILSEHAQNDLLRRVFEVTYNEGISFWITKAPLPDVLAHSPAPLGLAGAIESAIEVLANRNLTGNAAKSWLANTLSRLRSADAEVLSRIIERDLKCGATASTANKIWPNLIPEHPVMLCEADSEKARKKIVFPAYAQIKSDGMRVNVLVERKLSGVVARAYSRNGKPVDCLHERLMQDIQTLGRHMPDRRMWLDGELLVMSAEGTADRATGNGLGNKAIKGTISDEERQRFYITLWDIYSASVAEELCESLTYEERFSLLRHLIGNVIESAVDERLTLIKAIPTRRVSNWGEIDTFCSEVMQQGEEGLIVKNLNSRWENKRSKQQVKLKAELDIDLEVIGHKPGEGKNAALFGSLTCVTADRKLQVDVSGFTDAQRLEIFSEDFWVGRIICVRYNSVITSRNSDLKSLFLPRFICERPDKNKADICPQ